MATFFMLQIYIATFYQHHHIAPTRHLRDTLSYWTRVHRTCDPVGWLYQLHWPRQYIQQSMKRYNYHGFCYLPPGRPDDPITYLVTIVPQFQGELHLHTLMRLPLHRLNDANIQRLSYGDANETKIRALVSNEYLNLRTLHIERGRRTDWMALQKWGWLSVASRRDGGSKTKSDKSGIPTWIALLINKCTINFQG